MVACFRRCWPNLFFMMIHVYVNNHKILWSMWLYKYCFHQKIQYIENNIKNYYFSERYDSTLSNWTNLKCYKDFMYFHEEQEKTSFLEIFCWLLLNSKLTLLFFYCIIFMYMSELSIFSTLIFISRFPGCGGEGNEWDSLPWGSQWGEHHLPVPRGLAPHPQQKRSVTLCNVYIWRFACIVLKKPFEREKEREREKRENLQENFLDL